MELIPNTVSLAGNNVIALKIAGVLPTYITCIIFWLIREKNSNGLPSAVSSINYARESSRVKPYCVSVLRVSMGCGDSFSLGLFASLVISKGYAIKNPFTP
ncbi:hypothetical protein EVAR_99034_1 [Eumeta japonica]|uniref:Uncharacterized protein n=1 Tax=Eumeta variegata TaxID=151549 RepID=A0A4C1XXN3_EUMVA|nr:hypothetical protein EVAR_99034_1 [Eumeta japonica]